MSAQAPGHPLRGRQLSQLSGVAAILRFPLPLDELGDEDEDDESEEDYLDPADLAGGAAAVSLA